MLFGVWIFRGIQFLAHRRLLAAREHEDSVHQYFRNMTDGIKELKLHRLRRQAFLSDCVEATVLNCRQNRLSASLLYVTAINWGNGLFYVVIGTILFIVPVWQEIPPETAMGYSLVILYMMMPLPLLLESLPSLAKAGISLRKIQLLDKDITRNPREGGSILSIEERRSKPVLELSQVRYCYYGGEGRCEFALGPIDITLYPGELVFLIGGNGSGKSTLALLLVGLYSPESGAIRLDGETITEENIEYYRQQFSVVFFDFFLFETLLGFDNLEGNGKAHEYLKLLDLHHKVSIKDGKFSSLNLSQGQRKRLALLVAYLEDRPSYVFDEWAADQDPVFKKIFYTEILPSLKSRGKTVIVITHDDTYFSLADRCLKLQDGKLFEIPMANASYRYGKPDNFVSDVTAELETVKEA